MTRFKLRSAWGLALAVLFGGAIAKAEPPPPPPGYLNTVGYKDNLPSAPVPVPASPAPARPVVPPPPPAHHGFAPGADHGKADHAAKDHAGHNDKAHNDKAHGGHNGHGDEAHHEPEDHNAFIVNAEYLLFRPRRREQDFAIVGINPNWAPIGTIKNVDGGFDSGFRIGVGYHWCGGLEAVFQYTHLHTAGDDFVQAGNGLLVFPTLTHPAVVTEVAAARAENSVNLNLFDLELGTRVKQGEALTLRGFVGPRFVNLDQKMRATYTGGNITTDSVRRELYFDGAGFRAGGEVNYKFWEFLGVYARGSGSMLVGRFRSSLAESANGQPVVNVSEKYDKVVPVVDLGIGMSFQRGGCRISVGYEFMNWFGMVEGIDFGDDAHPSKLNRRWADLGFDGLVVRMEWLF